MKTNTITGLGANKIAKELKQWIVHNNKIPKQLNGYNADTTNPNTWHTYEQVKNKSNKGFVFTENDSLLFIDLDHVLDKNQQIKYDWARDIVDSINSYTEISFSGDGLHIIVESKEHTNLMHKIKLDNNSALEIYFKDRYATVTDNIFEDKTKIIKSDCDILYKYMKSKKAKNSNSAIDYNRKSELTRDEIIEKLQNKYSKGRILWDANDTYFKDDQSSADAQLSAHIVYYCNGEYNMFKEVFSLHEFGKRDKWIKREDYKKGLFELYMRNNPKFFKLKSKNPENQNISIYLYQNKYHILTPNIIYQDLTERAKNLHCKQLKIDKDNFNIITSIQISIDYFANKAMDWEVDKNGRLVITSNPIKNWDINLELDQNIIHDYTQNVLNNKLYDILLIVFLSIKFKENKLNKLLLVGASNKGKTKLAELMGFYDITASEFHKVFGNEQKKVHKETVEALKKCGLLHADDIQSHLPSNIKNIKDSARIDVMHGGAIKVPMKFLLMSTTNDEVISNANDEIANRILVVDIGDDKYTVKSSSICQKDTDKYELHCEVYIKKLIIEILNSDNTRGKLLELQTKYKINIDVNDIAILNQTTS